MDATRAGVEHVREHMYKFKHLKGKVVRQMEKHRGAAIHWFQNGHPMKALITHHDEMLGVDEKTARSFCKQWYRSKRQEMPAIWKQRKVRNGSIHEFSLSELQEQVRDIVERKRSTKPPEKTPPNDEYRKI
jgi:hypothetical protein